MVSSLPRQRRSGAAPRVGHPEWRGLDSVVLPPSPTPQPGACLHLPGLWGASTGTGFWLELKLEFVHVQNSSRHTFLTWLL